MCGRYSFCKLEGLEERFNVKRSTLKLYPRYNIAPTQEVPAIVNNGENQLIMPRWGLIPYWAKDMSVGSKMINARAETVDEKPSFKRSLQRRRCLVLADGFYEWKKEGRRKTPYRITLKNEEPFAFAGLWDSWMSPEGEVINSCTIITTIPNELMEPIHNRMPVILSPDVEEIWLDQSITDSHFLKSLLKPYPSEFMKAYEVSTLVNSPKNDLPECFHSKSDNPD